MPVILHHFIQIVSVLLFCAYSYQAFYVLYSLFCRIKHRFRPPVPTAANISMRRYALLICARNEENVIGQLINSLKVQDYPAHLIDIFVMADNCNDSTADAARNSGAHVYERFNTVLIGKGYALDELFSQIRQTYGPKYYDAYIIFDADNIVDQHFVSAMNYCFTDKYDVITSYRNSKNFAANWISACYSIWFLREARFLNEPRMNLGINCAISGTGFLVSSRLIEINKGWPFHLLTEDIEFSAFCAVKGYRIGYCDDAVLYDEQPVTFSQSWTQRTRWSRGFFQVNRYYALSLLRGCFSSKNKFSCYDMLMTIAPCALLTIFTVITSFAMLFNHFSSAQFSELYMLKHTLELCRFIFIDAYALFYICGLLTLITERQRIRAQLYQIVMYLPLFPLFMMTYIPISLYALVTHVQWKPIHHAPIQNA